ncbi:hypothetical protein WV31_10350 [Magnetospirillum sp. ME-1]|uniref:hypothetical protein n=1 Tax=Magnetospirillum sp. ME-1 TaxID=1639348 RepID=UPI000A17C547|nr:hypothetical protein [Magnetospirillum sp. ME-1]ARJ66027.1 hypothetical protein WV31_10350 [Magnetospirillum sp. ME-1]
MSAQIPVRFLAVFNTNHRWRMTCGAAIGMLAVHLMSGPIGGGTATGPAGGQASQGAVNAPGPQAAAPSGQHAGPAPTALPAGGGQPAAPTTASTGPAAPKKASTPPVIMEGPAPRTAPAPRSGAIVEGDIGPSTH